MEFTSQIKLVESDKKLLQEECAELREALRMLESNVDDELKQLDGEVASAESSGDVQKALREAKAKHEVCIFLQSLEEHMTYAHSPICSWNSASFARSLLKRSKNMPKQSVM